MVAMATTVLTSETDRRGGAKARRRAVLLGPLGVWGALVAWPANAQDPPAAVAPLPAGGAQLPGIAQPAAPFVNAFPANIGGIGFPYAVQGGGEPADPGRAWQLFGSIGVNVTATNNVFQTQARKADVYTSITPTIGVTANTERVLANIIYAPTGLLYATYTDQNRFNQNFVAQSSLALIPNTLFLDIQGFGFVTGAAGNQGPQAQAYVSRQNQIQNYDVRISPYAVFRFGSAATAQVGYAFQYGDQSGTTQFLNVRGVPVPYFSGQSFVGNRGYAVLRTGEDFGRVAVIGRIDGTAFSGTGVYNDSHRALANVDLRYAITPNLAVQVGGGYENQQWNTIPQTRIDDAIWNVGLRYVTQGGSWLILRYGHQDGFSSPYVNGNIVFGGRLSMQVNYFERLSTAGLFTQDLLASTTVDELGNAIDPQSRALVPVSPLLTFGSVLTAQNSLSRNTLGSGFLTYTWPRDTVSAGIVYREQKPVAFTPGFTAFQQSGWSGAVTWTHDISPRASTFALAQYGVTDSRIYGNGTNVSASLALIYRLTANLQANLQFFGQQNWSTTPNGDWSSAALTAGIRQSF